MMKNILFILLLVCSTAMVSASCSANKGDETKAVTDSLGRDWDSTSAPMAVFVDITWDDQYNVVGQSLMHVMVDQQDSARYTPIADTYHTFMVLGKNYEMKYQNLQNGPEMGSIITADNYSKYMKALCYDMKERLESEELGVAFNDAFMKNHQVLNVTQCNEGNNAPKALKDSLVARYKNEIKECSLMAKVAQENLAVYSVVMKPKGGKVLGMHVIMKGDTIYTHEEWTNVDSDGSYTWNVDMEEEYPSGNVIAVTKGDMGYDVFVEKTAPESMKVSALLLRDGKVNDVEMALYYNYVDYTPELEPTTLPKGSELKAELDGYKVWIHTDKEPNQNASSDEEVAGVYSVYYSTPDSKNVYKVVTSHMSSDVVKLWNVDMPWVEANNVVSAQEAFLVKNKESDTYVLIFQGCPDARNVYTYAVRLPLSSQTPMFRWIRAKEGYVEYDADSNLLIFDDYFYDEVVGRRSIRCYYNFDFELVNSQHIE